MSDAKTTQKSSRRGNSQSQIVARGKVDKQIERMSKLPIQPQILLNLNKVAEDDSASADDLGQIILKDQALTMRVLKVVNSAYYRHHTNEKISTVTKAVVILGFKGVRRLALGMSMYDMLRKASELPELRDFWCHSLMTAIAARQLSRNLGYTSEEEAFVAGLVHDVGKLVLANCDPPRYLKILHEAETSGALRTKERETYGLSHALAGKKLAKRWGMPAELEEIIGDHHAYETHELGPGIPLLLRVIIAADQFSCAILQSNYEKRILGENVSLQRTLDFNQMEVEEFFTKIVQEYKDLAQFFDVAALPVATTDEITGDIRPDVDRDVLVEQYHALSASVISTESQDTLIAKILDGLGSAVAVERLFLLQVDLQSGRMACVASRGDTNPDQESVFDLPASDSGSIVGRTLETRQMFHILVSHADEVSDPVDQAILEVLGCDEFATLPLVWQNHVLGVLWLDNPSSQRPLSVPMLQAAETMTNLLAFVLGSHTPTESISNHTI